MKIIIWAIVAIVIVGGIAWFISSDNSEANSQQIDNEENNNPNQISEDNTLETDDDVFNEIDDALNSLS